MLYFVCKMICMICDKNFCFTRVTNNELAMTKGLFYSMQQVSTVEFGIKFRRYLKFSRLTSSTIPNMFNILIYFNIAGFRYRIEIALLTRSSVRCVLTGFVSKPGGYYALCSSYSVSTQPRARSI